MVERIDLWASRQMAMPGNITIDLSKQVGAHATQFTPRQTTHRNQNHARFLEPDVCNR
jgi:hypothetical protein